MQHWKEGSIIIIHQKRARADSAHSNTSPKNEKGGAPRLEEATVNWSKTQRKSRTDDPLASARGVTTPSAKRAGWGNQQTPLPLGSPHHTSRGCSEGGDVESVVVRIPESRLAERLIANGGQTSQLTMAKTEKVAIGSLPVPGVPNASRITYDEWKTLLMETLVGRFLSMTFKILELRCTSNTVHHCISCLMRNTQKMRCSTLMKFSS